MHDVVRRINPYRGVTIWEGCEVSPMADRAGLEIPFEFGDLASDLDTDGEDAGVAQIEFVITILDASLQVVAQNFAPVVFSSAALNQPSLLNYRRCST